ncbi:hypothetical protein BDD12DRAFT_898931 [Trichophaea hybrida]|nr:hypothetical protein BDD12DRAFT_898931 [Trichophaea hybrida]
MSRKPGAQRRTVRPQWSQAPQSGYSLLDSAAGSSHSRPSLLVHSSAATTAAAPCSSSSNAWVSPGMSEGLTSKVAPSSPKHCPISATHAMRMQSLQEFVHSQQGPMGHLHREMFFKCTYLLLLEHSDLVSVERLNISPEEEHRNLAAPLVANIYCKYFPLPHVHAQLVPIVTHHWFVNLW